ncbi:hypothetical protein [Lentzea sp. NBRC 102530]|uniref:hypothetical protein n=1 Tax=Lentzea sp. NBRC 102530 TaxID=3032201 RepID=UPI00255432C3|nr:hypothetical protein [Lentzea sp. NBRC 102530]
MGAPVWPPLSPPPVRAVRPRGPSWALTGGLATVVAVLVVIVFALAAQDGSTRNTAGTPSAGPTPPAWQTTAPVTTVPPTTTTQPDVFTSDALARQALDQRVARDRASVNALVGVWIPQLSSKKYGLVVNSATFGYQEIWADYRAVQRRYPEALLLWSGEFASYDGKDFWVTVVPRTFSEGAEANSWCDAQGIGKDDCYAKKLLLTGTSAGTTVLRK